jgi:hypothetical protein
MSGEMLNSEDSSMQQCLFTKLKTTLIILTNNGSESLKSLAPALQKNATKELNFSPSSNELERRWNSTNLKRRRRKKKSKNRKKMMV